MTQEGRISFWERVLLAAMHDADDDLTLDETVEYATDVADQMLAEWDARWGDKENREEVNAGCGRNMWEDAGEGSVHVHNLYTIRL